MIQIDNLRLKKFDALNWTIERKRTNQDGDISWTNIGYYPSLGTAARNLFIKSIDDQDSIAGLIAAIENA